MIKIIDDDVEKNGLIVGEIDLPIQSGEYRFRVNPLHYAIHLSPRDLRIIGDELDYRNDRRQGE